MPGRKEVIATDEIYHIYNRGVASQPTFTNIYEFKRASNTFFYYRNKTLSLKYSKFISQSADRRQAILVNLNNNKDFLIDIIAFCLMPNHFHFLLKQSIDNGIAKFISKFTNSYTKYFNTKKKRHGTLFQGRFKAVRIETDEQLLHVSRYIHLNPYSSYVVRDIKNLYSYPFSSLMEYLGKTKVEFCNKEVVLGQFKDIASYRKFIIDRADYQKSLDEIKHLSLDY